MNDTDGSVVATPGSGNSTHGAFRVEFPVDGDAAALLSVSLSAFQVSNVLAASVSSQTTLELTAGTTLSLTGDTISLSGGPVVLDSADLSVEVEGTATFQVAASTGNVTMLGALTLDAVEAKISHEGDLLTFASPNLVVPGAITTFSSDDVRFTGKSVSFASASPVTFASTKVAFPGLVGAVRRDAHIRVRDRQRVDLRERHGANLGAAVARRKV